MNRTRFGSVKLGRSRLSVFYFLGVGLWSTGGLWLFFRYFLTKQGEFGAQTNPLEPWWLKLHGGFAIAFTWFFGLLWGTHVTVAWPRGRRRLSGGLLVTVTIGLIITGYLLYYVVDDVLRSIASIAHWTLGLAFPAFYLAHRKNYRRQAKLTAPAPSNTIP